MKPTILRFQPLLKQLIWGGRRLGERLGKPLGLDSDYAESWEIVDHGHDQSLVVGGPLMGMSLGELVRQHRAWLLGPASQAKSFPLLLKYLDCERVLSVQVHPDDLYGSRMPIPDRGKTEAWYVIDAAPGSLVYAGLRQGVGRDEFSQAIADGTIEQTLHAFHPEPGDCIFIPAGTVHAIGAGLLVAEIQQSSDTTFRIFDWNRTDAAGSKRKLHVADSLEVIDFAAGPVNPIRGDALKTGWRTLVDCDKFTFKSLVGGEATVGGDGHCHLLTVPSGSAQIWVESAEIELGVGETILIPAAMGPLVCTVSDGSCLLTMQPRE
jgi:mannose-6-phosphate isomerase